MKLAIIGYPKMHYSLTAQQIIALKYDPKIELTTINCDVDIVTLGLAVNVLSEQYEQYLAKLDAATAAQIRETTRKAVYFSGQNRSENSEYGSSSECRRNDGSNGKTYPAWRKDSQYGKP